MLIGLTVVLSSLFVVSYLAARVRPGAGTLLTLIAIGAVLAQWMVKGPVGLSLSHVAGDIAARPRRSLERRCRSTFNSVWRPNDGCAAQERVTRFRHSLSSSFHRACSCGRSRNGRNK